MLLPMLLLCTSGAIDCRRRRLQRVSLAYIGRPRLFRPEDCTGGRFVAICICLLRIENRRWACRGEEKFLPAGDQTPHFPFRRNSPASVAHSHPHRHRHSSAGLCPCMYVPSFPPIRPLTPQFLRLQTKYSRDFYEHSTDKLPCLVY